MLGSRVNAQRSVHIAGKDLVYAETYLYDVSPKPLTVFIAVPYAKAELLTPYNWSEKERQGKVPYEIDFVYSKFPFDTAQWVNKFYPLMPQRMKNLFALDPNLQKLPIKWRIIAQTSCVNEPLAQSVFHGFVIRYKYGQLPDLSQPVTEKRTEKADTQGNITLKDAEKLTLTDQNVIPDSTIKPFAKAEKLSKPSPDELIKQEKNASSEPLKTIPVPPSTAENITPNISPTAQIQPKSGSGADSLITNASAKNDDLYDISDDSDEIALIEKEDKARKKVKIITEKPAPPDTSHTPSWLKARKPYHGSEENLKDSPDPEVKFKEWYAKQVEEQMKVVENIIAGKEELHDSVVLKVLNRHPEWKDMTVVMDWTGSMYPFGAQVIRWHQMNIPKGLVKNLVIFNDGDDYSATSNHFFRKPKPMGKAGGIYYCNPKDVNDVIETMKRTMSSGDGGPDLEENDMEACMKALEKYPDTERILLIADKDSYVRDIDLLYKIRVPVYIIPCGFKPGIEPDYLTIAYHTKGGIYDANDDISFAQPEKVMRRSVIKIDKIKYLFNDETNRFEVLPRKRFFPF
jgi:hypothetical protein